MIAVILARIRSGSDKDRVNSSDDDDDEEDYGSRKNNKKKVDCNIDLFSFSFRRQKTSMSLVRK
jgi:hypothetical protein